MESLLLLVIIFGVFFIAIFLAIFFIRLSFLNKNYFDHTVFLIKIPKEKIEDNEKITAENIKAEIAKTENIFASLGSLRAQSGLKAWFTGRNDHFSFEIVAQDGLIKFYIAAPTTAKMYLEQQINAYYPTAVLEEVTDYNIFSKQGTTVGGYLKTKNSFIFPLKTYTKNDVDSFNSVLNVLSKVKESDGVAIQFVINSANKSWHKYIRKTVSLAHQKGSLREAMSGTGTGSLLSSLNIFSLNSNQQNKNNRNSLNSQQQLKRLTPMEEEILKGIENKNSKAGLNVNLRIIVSSYSQTEALRYLDDIVSSFGQFNYYEYGNIFNNRPHRDHEKKIISDFIFRRFNERKSFLLNTEELASLFHFPLKNAEMPNILWLSAKQAPAPLNIPSEGIVLGYNNYRGIKKEIRIKKSDRLRHTYIVGKSGVGKSVLLSNMAIQDILNGDGLCVLDPHGDLIEDIISRIPSNRIDDVVLFSPSDIGRPMGLNLLEFDPKYPEQKTFVINEMIGIFDKLYDLKATGGPIFEQYMRNAMLLIMGDPDSGSTLIEIPRVLADAEFRKMKLSKCKDQSVVNFWIKEAEKAGGDAALANVVPYITSKLTTFISNDMMRPIIGQQTSSFNVRDLMDNKKILLVNLPKGSIGELNAYLLGMIVVGKILMASLSRVDIPREDRKDFYLYIDEFQNFTTESICQILSEARKYGLGLVIAHQYIGQLSKKGDTTIKDAVFGNVGTIASFKVGSEDADFLKKEFAPTFNEYDLVNVEKYTAFVKLLIDNSTTKPFTMNTQVLLGNKNELIVEKIKTLSRLKYGRDRSIVEAEIKSRTSIFN